MQFLDSLPVGFAEKLLADTLSSSETFVTVDTEFIREHLETPLLCLLQLGTANEVYIIDCSTVDIRELNPIFECTDLTKVFHSARQDIEILLLHGVTIRNVYDTQLYEMVLGTKSDISYRAIVAKYLGVQIKKDYSLSDWAKRPLSKKQLWYSANDVFYLRKVYKNQIRHLRELKRTDWLDDEISALLDNQEEEDNSVDAESQFIKLLSEWRSRKSEQLKRSIDDVISDQLIKSICKKGRSFIQKVLKSRHNKNKLLDCFLTFADQHVDLFPVIVPVEKNDAAVDILKTVLDICSQKANVVSHMIATSEELHALVRGDRQLRCLSGWRREIFGNLALQILHGEIALRFKDGKVEFI